MDFQLFYIPRLLFYKDIFLFIIVTRYRNHE